MQTTFLSAGIACAIAAIIGGGLKAFGIDIPVLRSTKRQLALGVLGTVFICVAFALQPRSVAREPVSKPPPHVAPHLFVKFSQRGGPFIIIGPNPSGVFAPGHMRGTSWCEMDVFIENQCAEQVYIDPSIVWLFVSSRPSLDKAANFQPTTLGLQFQPERLKSGWLPPGQSTSGRLVYELPEHLVDGTASNGAYKLIRLYQSDACTPEYKPY